MIVTARTLREWSSLPRKGVDEHVAHCEVCAESTPHVRVLRRRLVVLVATLALFVMAAPLEALRIPVLAGALATLGLWYLLRRRDRRHAARCVRCLDRAERKGGDYDYLIDIF